MINLVRVQPYCWALFLKRNESANIVILQIYFVSVTEVNKLNLKNNTNTPIY